MFKVPDWEDTPVSKISFTKDSTIKSKRKNKKSKTLTIPKQVTQSKPKFKAKTKTKSKNKLVNGVQKPSIKKKLQKCNELNAHRQESLNVKDKRNIRNKLGTIMKDSDIGIEIKNYKTDKLDEMILDAKKQRLEDTYKNYDNEEIFQESSDNVMNNIKNIASSTKTIKMNNPPTDNISPSKQELNSSEVKNKQIICKDKIVSNTNKDIHNSINSHYGNEINVKNVHKKNRLKAILQQNKDSLRNHVNVSGNKLRERMLDRLKAAKFRYLNEKLYTSSGSDAQQLFQADPSAFQTYHEGYQQQVRKWPVKPLDVIVKRIQKMPKSYVIGDMGCGSAELSRRVAQAVRSFDLAALAPGVETCDMARTPLPPAALDAAVYCLALMGTDLTQYLIEANRVLKLGGHLLIAEVESRFDSIDSFSSDVQRLGFSLKKVDDSHQVFFFLEFTKVRDPPVKKGKLPTITLKPCIYKKR